MRFFALLALLVLTGCRSADVDVTMTRDGNDRPRTQVSYKLSL